MPVVERTRALPAAPQSVWEVVGDPGRLAEWWPGVRRVEDASPSEWTTVVAGRQGRSVRADYTLVDSRPPYSLSWRQALDGSPFERILSESVTDVELEPAAGGTLVRLTARLRLRGLSRLGGVQVSRATARQLDEALDSLHAVAGGGARAD